MQATNQKCLSRREYLICRQTGRNPDNPKSRQSGLPTVQMLEIVLGGVCGCLTSVQKDNLVLEMPYTNCSKSGGIQNYEYIQNQKTDTV